MCHVSFDVSDVPDALFLMCFDPCDVHFDVC